MQTLVEREAAFAQAEQSTRQLDGQLEERRRQTQALVLQAQLQEVQQVRAQARASSTRTRPPHAGRASNA